MCYVMDVKFELIVLCLKPYQADITVHHLDLGEHSPNDTAVLF